MASFHALFDVLGLDGGRGQTVNDLVDRDRELPANTVKLDKANLNKTRLVRQSQGRERERERQRGRVRGKRERGRGRERDRERGR